MSRPDVRHQHCQDGARRVCGLCYAADYEAGRTADRERRVIDRTRRDQADRDLARWLRAPFDPARALRGGA